MAQGKELFHVVAEHIAPTVARGHGSDAGADSPAVGGDRQQQQLQMQHLQQQTQQKEKTDKAWCVEVSTERGHRAGSGTKATDEATEQGQRLPTGLAEEYQKALEKEGCVGDVFCWTSQWSRRSCGHGAGCRNLRMARAESR